MCIYSTAQAGLKNPKRLEVESSVKFKDRLNVKYKNSHSKNGSFSVPSI